MGAATRDAPRTNLIGDPYYTDGLRAVLFFESRPFSLAELEFLNWEVPLVVDVTAVARPPLFDDTALRARASTQAADGIRASVALPNQEESRAIFGIDLSERDMQPVWLEVENHSDRRFWFLPTAVDPEYSSPLEVGFAYHRAFSDEANAEIDQRLQSLSFDGRRPILPGSTVSGFVFASHPRGARAVDVDLVGVRWSRGFSMIVAMPGGEEALDRLERAAGAYQAAELLRIDDEAELRGLLDRLPCCTSDAAGAGKGAPLNLILIGDMAAWIPALVRRGYRDAALSPHHVFGRPQDLAGEKRGLWVAAQPQAVRIWHTPIRYGDQPVWVAQVSAPLGGRFASPATGAKPPPTAPRVDEARDGLLQDLLYSQAVTKLGFVEGAGRASAAGPRPQAEGASYNTNRLRAVMVFERRPVALSEIQSFDWERLADDRGQTVDGSTAP